MANFLDVFIEILGLSIDLKSQKKRKGCFWMIAISAILTPLVIVFT